MLKPKFYFLLTFLLSESIDSNKILFTTTCYRSKIINRFFTIFYLLLFFFSVLNPLYCFGQEVPRIIPPSPEAVSLFKYQSYPVDHSTGLTQIKIPLYEVKLGTLTVPIELNYHASGRKIEDQDGAISLGWTLMAGGSISRTVKGSADFGQYKFPSPFITDGLSNLNNYVYLEQISHFKDNLKDVFASNWKDSEYDIFSYYFGNNSGNFIFKDVNNVKTPLLIPYKPYVIKPTYSMVSDTYSELAGINILDDKGVLYEFIPTGHYTDNAGFRVSNEFNLSKIISANKVDTISFKYTSINQTRATVGETITAIDKVYPEVSYNVDPTGESSTFNTSYEFYSISRLTEINFGNSKVIFNLVSGSNKIDNIKVIDDNKIIKNIQLNRSNLDSYSVGTERNLTTKLDRIIFRDISGVNIENFSFEYYPTLNQYGTETVTIDPHHRDWWGYYNASGTRDLVPEYKNLSWVSRGNSEVNHRIGNSSANRIPKLNGARSGVLKKINYPTGGSTEFIYELNRYAHYSSSEMFNGPGLRIYQIKDEDKNGTTSFRTYSYGEDEKGYGKIELTPDIQNMAKESHYYYFMPNEQINPYTPFANTAYRERIFYDDFIPEAKELANRPVIYTTVTEYRGTEQDNVGKTVYNYDHPMWTLQNLQTGRNDLSIQRWHITDYDYWDKPSLIAQKEYKNWGGFYYLIKEKKFIYSSTLTEKVYGLHVQRLNIFPQKGRAGDPDPAYSGLYVEPWAIKRAVSPANLPYGFSKYQITSGYKNLIRLSQTIYNDDGTINKDSIEYSYNSRQYLSHMTSNTSDNGSLKTETKYPFDFQGDAVLLQMSNPNVNMLAFPIEEIKYKNNIQISATKTDYFNWGSTIPWIYPRTIQTRTSTLPYEIKVQFHRYDNKGNILSMSKQKGPIENYVWSYKKRYLVAKILNTNYSNIETLLGGANTLDKFSSSNPVNQQVVNNFLIGLRTADTNNLQISTFTHDPLVGVTSETDVKGMTTSYEYDSYYRLITVKDNVGNIVKNYKYNYSDGSENVAGQYFNKYVSKNFAKNNCTSGYGTVETYRVLANRYSSSISQADADAKAIADIEANGQKYANANGRCYFLSKLKEKTFTKNNCEVGVNGSKVNYVVPGQKYRSFVSQADADAMADADINLNGQIYANVNGACGFHNGERLVGFTKNNCLVNEIPSEVTYKVAARKYYSPISQEAADAMAQAEINLNGQNFANANGVCRKPVNFSFSNSTTDSFGIVFTDDIGVVTSFSCPPGYSSIVLPQSIYTISVKNFTSNINRRLYVGARTEVISTQTTFSGVNVRTGFNGENSIGMLN